MIFKLILCFCILIVMPLILGLNFIKPKDNHKNSILYAYLMGYLMEFAIFQLIAVPMIFGHFKFTTLCYLWTEMILLLDAISLISNRKKIKDTIKIFILQMKALPKIAIITIFLIGIQVYIPFHYMYINNDDAQYIAMSTTAIETNTLIEYSALTGKKYAEGKLPIKRALSPFQLYIAVISELVSIPPAILAHTVFPVIFILMGYAIYLLICKQILKLDNQETAIFLIFLSICNIFGNFSSFTSATYFLIRIWQGKAIVAGICIPLAFLLLNHAMETQKKVDWFAIILLSLSAALASTIGNVILILLLEILAFIFTVKDRKISYLIKTTLCCIPNFVYSLIYFIGD